MIDDFEIFCCSSFSFILKQHFQGMCLISFSLKDDLKQEYAIVEAELILNLGKLIFSHLSVFIFVCGSNICVFIVWTHSYSKQRPADVKITFGLVNTYVKGQLKARKVIIVVLSLTNIQVFNQSLHLMVKSIRHEQSRPLVFLEGYCSVFYDERFVAFLKNTES